MQRNCPERFTPVTREPDTPVKGSLRGVHLIDWASVYVKVKLTGVDVPWYPGAWYSDIRYLSLRRNSKYGQRMARRYN